MPARGEGLCLVSAASVWTDKRRAASPGFIERRLGDPGEESGHDALVNFAVSGDNASSEEASP
jgi:hypothetical protein